MTFGPDLLARLDAMGAEALVAWALEAHGNRAAIGTSFQLSGSVLIHMAHRTGRPFRVYTVDTHRLHAETYAFLEEMERRYGLKVERYVPDESRVRSMVERHGEYLFFDSPEKQAYCCRVRKVEPNEKALATLDVWITGLRRDQSAYRAGTVHKTELLERGGRQILKLAPLADWTLERLQGYARENGVPVHPLHAKGYVSIGCVICTTPVLPGEPPRAGRWRWQNAAAGDLKKECGLHLPPPPDAGPAPRG